VDVLPVIIIGGKVFIVMFLIGARLGCAKFRFGNVGANEMLDVFVFIKVGALEMSLIGRVVALALIFRGVDVGAKVG
jgi:hypothetical protein